MIRFCVMVCMFMLNSSLVFAKEEFVGDWFFCDVKQEYSRGLSIEKNGQIYNVFIEEGSTPNTYSGAGKLVNGQLHVKGCGYYRDELKDGCDIKNPSVIFKLKKSDLKRKYKNLDLALQSTKWIRVTKENEGNLMDRCRELAEQQHLDKDGWPKDF